MVPALSVYHQLVQILTTGTTVFTIRFIPQEHNFHDIKLPETNHSRSVQRKFTTKAPTDYQQTTKYMYKTTNHYSHTGLEVPLLTRAIYTDELISNIRIKAKRFSSMSS